ncbi:MAG: 16S rRNA (uracil(1498)-N(3))-methyltransferase [Eubacteriaceae bacterium]|nr:16S rRNA (uracil(1498)-N(3))-methyltransferase [Eubacteriaceae bacterium]
MHRVFTDEKNINAEDKFLTVAGEDAYHLIKVMRIKKGEKVTVCDKNNTDYTCEAAHINKDSIIFNIIDSCVCEEEKNYKITLCQAMPKGAKIETVLQKAVELGADNIVIFYSERCDVKYNKSKEDAKLERYNKIIYEAAKQCNRGIIPTVEIKKSFDDMIKSVNAQGKIIMAYEEEKTVSLKQVLLKTEGSICFIVGPEGGFELSEVQLAKDAGAEIVSLGKRILRTETAGMFMLSCCAYEKELSKAGV